MDESGAVVPYWGPVAVGGGGGGGRIAELREQAILAHYILAGSEYTAQKRYLDAENEKSGSDVFVANYQIFKN